MENLLCNIFDTHFERTNTNLFVMIFFSLAFCACMCMYGWVCVCVYGLIIYTQFGCSRCCVLCVWYGWVCERLPLADITCTFDDIRWFTKFNNNYEVETIHCLPVSISCFEIILNSNLNRFSRSILFVIAFSFAENIWIKKIYLMIWNEQFQKIIISFSIVLLKFY